MKRELPLKAIIRKLLRWIRRPPRQCHTLTFRCLRRRFPNSSSNSVPQPSATKCSMRPVPVVLRPPASCRPSPQLRQCCKSVPSRTNCPPFPRRRALSRHRRRWAAHLEEEHSNRAAEWQCAGAGSSRTMWWQPGIQLQEVFWWRKYRQSRTKSPSWTSILANSGRSLTSKFNMKVKLRGKSQNSWENFQVELIPHWSHSKLAEMRWWRTDRRNPFSTTDS